MLNQRKRFARGGGARPARVTDALHGLWDSGAGALRGFATQALGAPGDLEALARAGYRGLSAPSGGRLDAARSALEDPYLTKLPPSEFFNDWLPATGADTSTVEALGANVLPFALGAPGMVRSARELPGTLRRFAARGAQHLAEPRLDWPMARQAGAIKPRGGSWRSYDVVDPAAKKNAEMLGTPYKPEAISGLDVNIDHVIDNSLGDAHARQPAQHLEDWTRKNLRRYLQTSFGSPDDPLSDYMVAETRAGRAPDIGFDGPGMIADDFERNYPVAERDAELHGLGDYDPRDFFTAHMIDRSSASSAYGPDARGLAAFKRDLNNYSQRVQELLQRGLSSSSQRGDKYGDQVNFEFPDDFEGFAAGGRVARRRPPEYLPIAERAGAHYQLPPGLLESLIDQESNWDPAARSPRDAVGLTQLLSGTARDMGVDDRADPQQSAWGGAKYLRQLKDKFGTWEQALTAYNWGPGNVERKGYAAAPPSTKGYIGRVLAGLAQTPIPQPSKDIIMQKLAVGEGPPPAMPGVAQPPSAGPEVGPGTRAVPGAPQQLTAGPDMGPGVNNEDPTIDALIAELLGDDEEMV